MNPLDIFTDIDEITPEDENERYYDEVLDTAPVTSSGGWSEDRSRDRLLRFGVIASVVLHLGFLASIPVISNWTPASPVLGPRDVVRPVRLVEYRSPKTKEPPPEHASAISDRNHTAERERLPKQLPGQPIGQKVPNPLRMTALPPPMAPEDLVKPQKPRSAKEKNQERKKEKQEQKASQRKTKATSKSPDAKREVRVDAKRDNKEFKPFDVDLRPTPQEIRKGLMASRGPTEFFSEGDVEEAVVDLNSREERFFSYLLHLKHKIEQVWIYPQAAARSGIGGKLAVEFVIANSGRLLDVNLLDTSGHTMLDESALSAIRTAAPYFPFPARLKAKRLRVRANFIYVTGNYFGRRM